MHRKKLHAVIAIIIIISVGYSCKKKKQEENFGVYAPTTYALQYPDFVTANIGAPVISPDNALTVEGVALGRKLFFDKRLSKDMTISCGSCHLQSHAFDDSTQFSKGVNGTLGDRNAMPIINMAWGSHFFWDGRRNSLEGQAHDPVVNPKEMASKWPEVTSRLQQDTEYPALFFHAFGTSKIDSDLVVKAIAQFERTLISFKTAFDTYAYRHEPVFNLRQLRGYEAFQRFNCPSCHSYGLFTDHSFRNNGLDQVPVDSGLVKVTHNLSDYGKFKVPTLRNIALTAPYMHDGRFATLSEVVGFYSRGFNLNSPNIDTNIQNFALISPTMTRQEQEDIVTFLETLTDTSFIMNVAFGNQ